MNVHSNNIHFYISYIYIYRNSHQRVTFLKVREWRKFRKRANWLSGKNVHYGTWRNRLKRPIELFRIYDRIHIRVRWSCHFVSWWLPTTDTVKNTSGCSEKSKNSTTAAPRSAVAFPTKFSECATHGTREANWLFSSTFDHCVLPARRRTVVAWDCPLRFSHVYIVSVLKVYQTRHTCISWFVELGSTDDQNGCETTRSQYNRHAVARVRNIRTSRKSKHENRDPRDQSWITAGHTRVRKRE